jgi:IrrE N-terminal-like domain
MMQPELYAQALLDRLALGEAPDVHSIASTLGIPVRESPLESCEGMLVRVKGTARAIIAIRDSIREYGRRLFTIAHELGHLILPGHEDCGICTTADIESWTKELQAREREANNFAAELLMPRPVVASIIRASDPSLAIIDSLAGHFRTSLTATGYRFAEITSHACAIVWSQNRAVRWAKKSEDFRHWLRLRESVDARTLASDLFDGSNVPTGLHAVPADAWIASRVEDGSLIFEESRPLPYYGAVITLLWVREPLTGAEETELEPLDPDEFSIRRRHWPTKRGR